MFKTVPSRVGRQRRHLRVRAKVQGSAGRPRLCVFRSSVNIYAQLVDDATGRTLTTVSTLSPEFKDQGDKGKKTEQAASIGKLLAQKAIRLGIQRVVFDRGGYRYHGRVKALADSAREGGLIF